MSPPRRPRGEKPATTIRWQRRQMAQLTSRIAALVEEIDNQEQEISTLRQSVARTSN